MHPAAIRNSTFLITTINFATTANHRASRKAWWPHWSVCSFLDHTVRVQSLAGEIALCSWSIATPLGWMLVKVHHRILSSCLFKQFDLTHLYFLVEKGAVRRSFSYPRTQHNDPASQGLNPDPSTKNSVHLSISM